MKADETHANGWTAVPVSAKKIFESLGSLSPPAADDLKDSNLPSEDPVVIGAVQFVKARLSTEAFNQSMKVFYWGESHFSLWPYFSDDKTYSTFIRHRCRETNPTSAVRSTFSYHLSSDMFVPQHWNCKSLP
jgi:hypothetical protein